MVNCRDVKSDKIAPKNFHYCIKDNLKKHNKLSLSIVRILLISDKKDWDENLHFIVDLAFMFFHKHDLSQR